MKKQLILALAVFGLIAAPAAQAEQHEIFTQASSGSEITLDPFNVDLGVGYGYFYNDMIEVTGRVGLSYDDSLASDKFGFNVFVGPRFNFGGAINDAFWAGGEIGITSASGSSEFGWGVNAGKRFNIAGNANYTPLIQFADNGFTADGDADFSIVPIAFSFTW